MSTFTPINEVRDAKAARKRRKAFYTPLGLVDKLVEWADVWPSARVLEPSAGDGRIIHALQAVGVKNIDACELDEAMRARCGDMGAAMIGGDFLKCRPEPIYDRVVMNPPFECKSADNHIAHAYAFLKPGGQILSIAPATTASALADEKLALPDCEYATFEELSVGLFKEFGTNIRTLVVEIYKRPASGSVEVEGFKNWATWNAALSIGTDSMLWNRWIEGDKPKQLFASEHGRNGQSIYGVDWMEVKEYLLSLIGYDPTQYSREHDEPCPESLFAADNGIPF